MPSDHAAVLDVTQKPTIRVTCTSAFRVGMSKHIVLCSTLKQISDDHQCPDDRFVALADDKVFLEKARKQDTEQPGSQAF